MTKKAENIYKKYEEAVKLEVSAVRHGVHSRYDFSEKYINDAYDEFFDMICGMLRFELLKANDVEEMSSKAEELKERLIFEIHDLKAAQ